VGGKLPSETSQKALKGDIKNEVIKEFRKTELKPTGWTHGGGNKDGAKNPSIICNKCKEIGQKRLYQFYMLSLGMDVSIQKTHSPTTFPHIFHHLVGEAK